MASPWPLVHPAPEEEAGRERARHRAEALEYGMVGINAGKSIFLEAWPFSPQRTTMASYAAPLNATEIAMEIELKLRLPPSALAALRADPLLAKLRTTRKQLDNIYFDTPQRTLELARIGLRLRRDGRRWLQTVKGGGNSNAGLHQREEIEFAVAGPALEWLPLAGTSFEPVLKPLKAQLAPQFRTHFARDPAAAWCHRGRDRAGHRPGRDSCRRSPRTPVRGGA
ncbi:CYTH domain-containing protein [Polaromonas sp. P2-4]|nr:CYTH domain-containing protein [Polaromonas sp. P2-4]